MKITLTKSNCIYPLQPHESRSLIKELESIPEGKSVMIIRNLTSQSDTFSYSVNLNGKDGKTRVEHCDTLTNKEIDLKTKSSYFTQFYITLNPNFIEMDDSVILDIDFL